MSSGVLKEIDRNILPTMAMATEKGQNGEADDKPFEQLACDLPVPFVEGRPIDYQRMSVEQLRRFIPFMFRSKYKQNLPNTSRSTVKAPSWWPATVTFNKFLRIKSTSTQKGLQGQQKELCGVVQKCYEFEGVPTLLALGLELSHSDSGYQIRHTVNDSTWKVIDPENREIALIDSLSRVYDIPRRKRPSLENESQENIEISPAKPRPARKRVPALKPKAVEKDEQRDLDVVDKLPEPVPCAHCGRLFKIKEFRDDHEAQCIKGPFLESQSNQMNFMSALGMFGNAQPPKSTLLCSAPPSTVASDTDDSSNSRSKSLRRLPKRNQLLTFFKNNPLPISSLRGQKLVYEFGEKVEHPTRPSYEKYCESRSLKREKDKDYPSVTKRIILKHSEFPHVYSYGRRQRCVRYQELVVGVERGTWKVLNACKKPKLKLTKLPSTMGKVTVSVKPDSKTFLERKWLAAMLFPKVRLVDIKKLNPKLDLTKDNSRSNTSYNIPRSSKSSTGSVSSRASSLRIQI